MSRDRDKPKADDQIRIEAIAAAGRGEADSARELLKIADEMDNTKNGSVPPEPPK